MNIPLSQLSQAFPQSLRLQTSCELLAIAFALFAQSCTAPPAVTQIVVPVTVLLDPLGAPFQSSLLDVRTALTIDIPLM